MHPNPAFRNTSEQTALEFVREMGFGLLTVNGAREPLISHIPYIVDGDHVDLHLVRSNPIARLVKEDTSAKIAVVGPHSYISPDWYGVEDQVPTWNYVAVHLTGQLSPLTDEDLLPLLDKLSDEFETRLAPKPVWKTDKVSEDALKKMLRMIQPFRFTISDIQSTYKLNQNKPDAARLAAAEHIATDGIGSETGKLAQLQISPPSEDPK